MGARERLTVEQMKEETCQGRRDRSNGWMDVLVEMREEGLWGGSLPVGSFERMPPRVCERLGACGG